MIVLNVRNVHEALPKALDLLEKEGIQRPSRNGPVLQYPTPVATVYEKPCERVIFWPERDANPFFHLYEALWMLAGRNDVQGPARYVKQFLEYSDDGRTVHGAYGYRWSQMFVLRVAGTEHGAWSRDQLEVIARTLQKNPEDRRCVLQMWDAESDLGYNSKDLPCNVTATFQISVQGRLNLTVFCRSNDIVWGCYGANAVHFSVLLEYMAAWIGVPVGTYTQVSVNWHGYLKTFEPLKDIPRPGQDPNRNPYAHSILDITSQNDNIPVFIQGLGCQYMPLLPIMGTDAIKRFDRDLIELLAVVDAGCHLGYYPTAFPFLEMTYQLLLAHHLWQTLEAPGRYDQAIKIVYGLNPKIDWVVAAMQWLQRRHAIYRKKTGA